MIVGLAIVFITFTTLTIATLLDPERREHMQRRRAIEWIVDFSGLLTQGLAIPLFQTEVLSPIFAMLFPRVAGQLVLPWWAAFLMSFVVIDYAYYWNHRVLHRPRFWRWHRLHHTAEHVDIFVTARNSIFTPVFFVYVWLNALFAFLLSDSTAFVVASSVGAALDVWRHSGFRVAPASVVYRVFGRLLILPQHHARHHANDARSCNFGANLKIWDHLHGTLEDFPAMRSPENRKVTYSVKELFWPGAEDTGT